ncbi:hypothetical protein GOP47_0030185 [Adiantum capillus-veneris]|nr:hypothetical protein GOP47_0030185 [Adiantum capillus-veneris]
MESSLASLFMEGNCPCLPLSWATSGESVEELQQQLTSTSLELQSAREMARIQNRINEAKICRMQALLDAARKERDEARTNCSKLRECLLQLSHSPQVPVPVAESPSSCLPSSISSTSSPIEFSHPASPTVDTMSLDNLKQTGRAAEGAFEHDRAIKISPHQASDVQDIFALEQNEDPSSITIGHSQPQFSMDILSEDVSLNEEESLDLSDLHMETSPRSAWDLNPSNKSCWDMHVSDDSSAGNTLLRQSSSMSTAGSDSLGGLEHIKELTSLYKKPISMPGCVFPMQSMDPLLMTSHPRVVPEAPRFANQIVQQHSSAMQLKAAHGEPSESGASTMQAVALPERGKLLQAVMQAGPLLQNLLLAGRLPQWRYPPPQLSTVDIPKVPMVTGSLPLKFPPSMASGSNNASPIHYNPLVNFSVNAPQFADERGVLGSSSAPPSTFASKSGRNICYGGRKLRRLSPIGVK